MASSSGSPTTSDELYPNSVRMPRYLPRPPRSCEHGNAVLRRSRTPDNPGRRFYYCRLRNQPGGCDYWDWVDEPLTDHYRAVMNEMRNERDMAQEQLRHALLRERMNSDRLQPLTNECIEAQKTIADMQRNIEDLDCCTADLQSQIEKLEATVAAQKKKIRVAKKAFCLLLIIMASVFWMK